MKKILLFLYFAMVSTGVSASFIYQEIDPICSISGMTHTSFPAEISDTSSWVIPKAYDGRCIPVEKLSTPEKRKIYKVIVNFLDTKNFLDDSINSGYVLNTQGREYINNVFFPTIGSFIAREVKKTEPNTSHIAILNYAVSIIGYDYFIEGMNLSWEYTWLTLEAAKKLADDNKVAFRVVERDGEVYAVTLDYVVWRINAVVENNIVVSYTVE